MILRKLFLFAGDLILFYFAIFSVLLLRFQENFSIKIFEYHLLPFFLLSIFWFLIFYAFGFYEFNLFRSFALYLRAIIAGIIIFFISSSFFYFISFAGITPKTNLFLIIFVFIFFIILWRKIFYNFFSSYFKNKTVILGKNYYSEEIAKILQENPHLGYKFIGFWNSKNFEEKIKTEKIETLILGENISQNPFISKVLYNFLPLKLNLLDIAPAYEKFCEKIPIDFVQPIWFLNNFKEKEVYEKLKRIIDIALSSIILFLTFPLWIFIILAIKIEDNGPIFYCQKRIGQNKKIFSLIKFRSMKKNAEKEGIKWAEIDDERATRVGTFLRKLHLDEIPQMINIIRGDISLVGPRPERPEFVEKLEKEIPYYNLRHLIKPGFTGWAQIKFRYARSVMDSFEKFQYDLFYLKNRSFALDLKILLKTVQLFFKKQ